MGCVSYSQRYFADGKISKGALRQAEIAARTEVQAIAGEFSAEHWQQAIGSSGTAKALSEILQMNGFSDSGITAEGLAKLREAMLKAGDCINCSLQVCAPTVCRCWRAASPSWRRFLPNWILPRWA